jgi:hypothetical protein
MSRSFVLRRGDEMIYEAVNIFVNTKKTDKERKESEPSLLISLRCQKKRRKKTTADYPLKSKFPTEFHKALEVPLPGFSFGTALSDCVPLTARSGIVESELRRLGGKGADFRDFREEL